MTFGIRVIVNQIHVIVMTELHIMNVTEDPHKYSEICLKRPLQWEATL